MAIKDLTDGMVLAKNLRLKDGRLLAQKGTRLKESSIKAIKTFAKSKNLIQPILVSAQETS